MTESHKAVVRRPLELIPEVTRSWLKFVPEEGDLLKTYLLQNLRGSDRRTDDYGDQPAENFFEKYSLG
jgi:hypothetical protein